MTATVLAAPQINAAREAMSEKRTATRIRYVLFQVWSSASDPPHFGKPKLKNEEPVSRII
jgi:hypothetical protein